VDEAGGDAEDAADLGRVWQRVIADTQRRAAAMKTQVRLRRCNCFDGGDGDGNARCSRCHGRRCR
jgi:hypothetical protein